MNIIASLMKKILFNLFYPWINRFFLTAFEIYAESEDFNRRHKQLGLNKAVDIYFTYDYPKYWKRAIKEKWYILFVPRFKRNSNIIKWTKGYE